MGFLWGWIPRFHFFDHGFFFIDECLRVSNSCWHRRLVFAGYDGSSSLGRTATVARYIPNFPGLSTGDWQTWPHLWQEVGRSGDTTWHSNAWHSFPETLCVVHKNLEANFYCKWWQHYNSCDSTELSCICVTYCMLLDPVEHAKTDLDRRMDIEKDHKKHRQRWKARWWSPHS